jgi:hypothetical protein
LQVARLETDLKLLRAAGVAGVEDRAAQLRSLDPDKFFSAVQELWTAAAYLRRGHTVALRR